MLYSLPSFFVAVILLNALTSGEWDLFPNLGFQSPNADELTTLSFWSIFCGTHHTPHPLHDVRWSSGAIQICSDRPLGCDSNLITSAQLEPKGIARRHRDHQTCRPQWDDSHLDSHGNSFARSYRWLGHHRGDFSNSRGWVVMCSRALPSMITTRSWQSCSSLASSL